MDISVLYIDNEINNLHSFKAAFRRDARIFVAQSAQEGLKVLYENPIDIVFSDQEMENESGVDFLRQVSLQFPDCMRVLLTGSAYTKEVKAAQKLGYFHSFTNKPWDENQLKNLMNDYVFSGHHPDHLGE